MADSSADGESPLHRDFGGLVEALAKDAHRAWMEARLGEGWRLGETQDGRLRTTPLLVSYDELSDEQKEIDRKLVRTTLKGAERLGWRVEPPSDRGRAIDDAALAQLEARLSEALERARSGETSLTFDMDDTAEAKLSELTPFPVLQRALRGIRGHLEPAWRHHDERAITAQKFHRTMALFAIWPGTLAIVAAILQLMLAGTNRIAAADRMHALEVILVAVAGIAVVFGVVRAVHDRRIATRFIAERLRSLKFAALGWSELWIDSGAWEERLGAEVDELIRLPVPHAKACAADSGVTEAARVPASIDPLQTAAVGAFYRYKRLEFQKHYFERQGARAHRRAWPSRLHLSAVIFVLSVLLVVTHAIGARLSPHDGGSRPTTAEIWLVGCAAILPVLGFGLRAWLAAFEVPRSRNLFRAKARALEDYIRRNKDATHEPSATLRHIANAEDFFAAEHREWCRLQVEAEWFL